MNKQFEDNTSDTLQKKELMRLGVYLKDLFEQNNVWYCLAAGSMLGAIRHDGFIPWDTDLDFHITIKDMDRVRSLIKANPPENAYLRIRGQDHCTNSHDFLVSEAVEKCHVDIYQLIGVPKNAAAKVLFCYICYLCDMAFRHKHIVIADCKEKNKKKALVVKAITHIVPDRVIECIYKRIENAYDFDQAQEVKSLCSVYVPHDCISKKHMENTFEHKFENTEFMVPVEYDDYLTHMYGDYMTPVKY